MTLDHDDLQLAVMALRHVADAATEQSLSSSEVSGCAGAAKSCVDGYCLPKIKDLIARIQAALLELEE